MIEHTVEVTRVYHFSAAHQLANPARPAAENAALYGACHRAHGHNYYLEVTVAGAPDPRTGMAVDLEALDGHVRRTVIDQVDHAKLEDVPALAGVITTGESLARAFWRDRKSTRLNSSHTVISYAVFCLKKKKKKKRKRNDQVKLT